MSAYQNRSGGNSSGSGYPNSGYQSGSGYPSNQQSSGYRSSGYRSRKSGSTGYQSGNSSGYQYGSSGSGYQYGSGEPSGYQSGDSGYQSGYQSGDSSGYQYQSRYPSGYGSGSGYQYGLKSSYDYQTPSDGSLIYYDYNGMSSNYLSDQMSMDPYAPPVCAVEHNIWLAEGIVVALLSCLLSGFFVKFLNNLSDEILTRQGLADEDVENTMAYRLMYLIFLGQLVLIPMLAARYVYHYVRGDPKCTSLKAKLILEMLAFSSILALVATQSFDFMAIHLLTTFAYVAPTMVTLFYLFRSYKVLVPADSQLVLHSCFTAFATFCFKEFFLNRQFLNCKPF